jgi:NACHT conflict system protein
MPKGLSYLDAVRILGGSGPLAKIADNLLGGLLSVATAGGSDAALSFFDAKAEMVRLGSLVTAKINEMVRGYARYHRNERLLAASGVLVVASLFEALDDCFVAAGFDPSGSDPSSSDPSGFDRDQQLTLLQSRAGVESLLHDPLPLPSPARSYADLLAEVHDWCAGLATDLVDHLGGLAAATAPASTPWPAW